MWIEPFLVSNLLQYSKLHCFPGQKAIDFSSYYSSYLGGNKSLPTANWTLKQLNFLIDLELLCTENE